MSILTQARWAEDLVVHLLEQRNWEILARNWRRHGCELDVVARLGQVLAIVEVKYRRSYTPFAIDISRLLTHKKIMALRCGALRFLGEHPLPELRCVRLDLAIVVGRYALPSQNPRELKPKILYYDNVVPL